MHRFAALRAGADELFAPIEGGLGMGGRMTVSLLVAMDRNRVIGVDNALPWHLPADLKRFRQLTLGHPIVMGRKTYEAIGRPLPGRTNIVVTRQPGYRAEGCVVAHGLDEALRQAEQAEGAEEVFVIGGGDLFVQTMGRAEKIYVTEVDTEVRRGDAYFPEIDPARWVAVERVANEPDDKNPYRYTYGTYVPYPPQSQGVPVGSTL